MDNFNLPTFVQNARTQGVPDEQIYNYLRNKNLMPTDGYHIAPAGTEQSQDKGFLSNLADTTIGEHGAMGMVSNIVNPISAATTLQGANQVGTQARSMQSQADQFIKQAQSATDSNQKAYYIKQAHDLLSGSSQLSQQQGQIIQNTAQQTHQDVSLGKNLENIAGTSLNTFATLAPFSSGLKAATLAGKVGQGVALGATAGAGQAMTDQKGVGGVLGSAALGGAIGGFLPLLTKALGSVVKGVTGVTTGAGKNVIQQAIDNPDAVSQAMKEYATNPEAKQGLVEQAKNAVSDFLQTRNEEYGQQLSRLTSSAPGYQGKQAVVDSFMKNIGKFGGKIENGALTFTDSTLTKSDQSAIQQAFETIFSWKDTSIGGMDKLRQAVGNLMSDFKISGNSRANVILGKVKNDLVSSLSDNFPGYKNMLSQYGEKSQTAQNLMQELIGGTGSKPSTQLNNVMKIFKRDPSVLNNLTQVMGKDEANKFLNDISGAILSNWLPQGTMGNYVRAAGEAGAAGGAIMAGNLPLGATTAAGAAAMSPKIVGTAATIAGKAEQAGVNRAVRQAATVGAGKVASKVIKK